MKPSSKNYKWQETSCLNISHLFIPFVSFNFLCSLVISPHQENCLSPFHLWAHIKLTLLLDLFLHLSIFMFHLLQSFFPHVFCLPWLMTTISLALSILFHLPLIILSFKVDFYGISRSTLQVFGLGPLWFASWVHPPN
jgi:hypothetical protein